MKAAPAGRAPDTVGLVLGVDTTTPRGGIALVADGDTVAEVNFNGFVSSSRRLLPSLHFVLETLGIGLQSLQALAVTVGPGSFTGIRVGLATVRGLALGTGLPVAGVSTLAALADAAGDDGNPVVAWLDAGRNEIYGALLDPTADRPHDPATERLGPPAALLAELPARPLRFVGSGAARYTDLITGRPGAQHSDQVVRRVPFLAAAAGRLGEAALAAGTALPPEPRYLRPPDATRARG